MKRLLPVILCSLLVSSSATAQVLITEVQVDPTSLNDDGEWVEIHNTGIASVALDGWTLNDYTGTVATAEVTTLWAFPAGTTLTAGQVIVVAKFAGPQGAAQGYSNNTPANLFTTPASFEQATLTHDDVLVPNVTATGVGTSQMALSNAGTGDAVVLRDNTATIVSAVEWGTVDRTVAGAPAPAPATAGSLRRIANTGSSLADFQLAVTPDPFIGFGGTPGPTPPAISGTFSTPRHVLHGMNVIVTATITDADGIQTSQLFVAAATSSTGPATGVYTANAMTGGTQRSATYNPSPGASPATFHEGYTRYYVAATDTLTATSSDPPRASPAAANTAFHWRNVMPAAASPISDARAQGPAGNLLWSRHSARVEGVVLTRRSAFVANRTNFFILSQGSSDAIRVFDTALVPQDVMPGDVVRVTGMIDQFNGLRQIGEPGTVVEIIAFNAPVAAPQHNIANILVAAEQLESQLLYIASVSIVNPPATWPSNGNVDITDGSGMLTVRITSTVDLVGMAVPAGPFDIRGVLGQFAANGVGGYQFLPRNMGDVLPATPPIDGGILDAANPPVDGGVPGDTGVTADTGVRMDTGLPVDTGVPRDGTVGMDADTEVDSGLIARVDSGPRAGGANREEETGCSCSVSDVGSTSISLLVFFALVALARSRRR